LRSSRDKVFSLSLGDVLVQVVLSDPFTACLFVVYSTVTVFVLSVGFLFCLGNIFTFFTSLFLFLLLAGIFNTFSKRWEVFFFL